jgi:uncharacterized protein YkwD
VLLRAPTHGLTIAVATVCAVLVVTDAATASPARSQRATASVGLLAQGLVSEINAFRTQHHLTPLRWSSQLTSAALAHNREMAAHGYFAHASPDGSPFWNRLERFYPSSPAGSWSVGENLLWSSPSIGARDALSLWLASPEHRATLLTARWREIGLSTLQAAAVPGTFHGRETTFVTADFGVRT